MLLVLTPSAPAQAAGSRNLSSGGNRPFLEFRNELASGIARRTTIKVFVNPGETLNLGSSANGVGTAPTIGRIDYRDPAGSGASCPANVGQITTRGQELAGPLPNPGGYPPCVVPIAAGKGGVWEVDFVAPNPANPANPPLTAAGAFPPAVQPTGSGFVTAWDVTVRSAAGSEIPGRAFATYLALNMGANPASLESELYVQTRDGYRYRVDLNGLDPFGFILFANNKGYKNLASGEPVYRSLQLIGPNPGDFPPGLGVHSPNARDTADDVTHKLFFEPPAADLPMSAPSPSGPTWLVVPPDLPQPPSNLNFSGVEGTPGQAGSTPLGGNFGFDSASAGSFALTIDVNGNGVFGDANDRVLKGIARVGANRAFWDGRDGAGAPVAPSTTSYRVQMTINAGEVHFPFLDAESNPAGIIIERLLPASSTQERFNIYYDDRYTLPGQPYDYGLCAQGQAPPPPASARISGNPCYGTATVPRSGLSGVDSSAGARSFSANFGNRRAIDTWVYLPSIPVSLSGELRIVEADLSISKVRSPAAPTAGGPLNYTIVVTNSGPIGVSNAKVRDVVPPAVTNVTWSCTPGIGATCDAVSGSGNLISTTVDLPAGATATFAVNGTLATNASGSIVNLATIARPDDTKDPIPSNNSATDSFVIGPVLAATKQVRLFQDLDGSGNPSAGDVLEYTVVIANSGSGAALDVTYADRPDPNTALVVGSVTSTQGIPTSGNSAGNTSVGVNIGTIPPAGSVTVRYRVNINAPLLGGVTRLVNQGTAGGSNTARIPTDDPTTARPGDPTTIAVTVTPQLDSTKRDQLAIDADGDGQVSPGDTVEYTVIVTNSGNGPALATTFADTPDANTALVVGSVATSLGTVTAGNTAGDSGVGVDIGTIAPATSVTIGYRVTVDDPLTEGVTQLVNQGRFSGSNFPSLPTDDPTTGAGDDPNVIPLVASPRVEATKRALLDVDADGDGLPSPGDTLLYQISIVNRGNLAAADTTFADTPDANGALVVGSVQTSQGSVTSGNSAGDSSVGVEIGAIPGRGGSVTISYRVTIDNPLAAGVGELVNQGSVGGSNFPPVPTDDPTTTAGGDPTRVPLTLRPQIVAEKRATLAIDADGNGVASPGDTLEYRISLSNRGNGAAENMFYDDTPDPNSALVVGSVRTSRGAVNSGNTAGDTAIQVRMGRLPAGERTLISYLTTINTPLAAGVSRLVNQGIVSGTNFPPLPSDDPATGPQGDPTEVPVAATPLLTALKRATLAIDADGDGSPSPGDTLLYQVTIANRGSGTASNVRFADTPDANSTLVVGSAQISRGTITGGNTAGDTQVAADIGTIAGGGDSVTLGFQVTINSPLATGVSRLVNQGSVSSNELPPIPTDDPTTPEDDDPTIVPLSAAPVLAALKSVSLQLDADGDGLPSPGDTLLYQISIVNRGNGAASGVILTDAPDPNATLVVGSVQASQGSVTLGNTAGDTALRAELGTVPGGGANATVAYQVTINDPLAAGVNRLVNQGSVSSNELPPIPTDDPATPAPDDPTVVPLTANPRLSASKRVMLDVDADGDGVPSPGDTLRYQIVVVNDGNGAALAVTYRDVPDANTTLVNGSVQTSQGGVSSGNSVGDTTVGVSLGALAGRGASASLTYQVTINSPLAASVGQIVNQGNVGGSNTPRVPTDDPTTPGPDDPTTVPLGSGPRLEASKRVTLAVDADRNGVPSSGDTLRYQITIANSGSRAATGVTFSDTPDANTALVAGSVQTSQGTISSGNAGTPPVTVVLGTILGGNSASVGYDVTIRPGLAPGVTRIVNQGSVTSNELAPIPTDDPTSAAGRDPATAPVGNLPELALVKRASLLVDADGDRTASPGDTLLYQVEIANRGNGPASGLVFNDTPDANSTLVAGSVQTSQGTISSGNAGAPPVTVDLGTLAAGSSIQLSFQVTINNPLPAGVNRVVNQARLTSNELPPLASDDPTTTPPADATEVPVSTARGLRISKSDGGVEKKPGEIVTYSLNYTNTSSLALFDLVVQETVPEHTRYSAAGSSPGWSCADGAEPGTICTLPVALLGPGAGASSSFAVRLNDTLPATVTTITNVVTIRSSTGPASSSDPSASDSTPVVRPTAIVLRSFTVARLDDGSVAVRWVTAQEIGSYAFLIYRSTGERAEAVHIGNVVAARGGGIGASYSIRDTTAAPGSSYRYWLIEIEVDGDILEYGPVTLEQ